VLDAGREWVTLAATLMPPIDAPPNLEPAAPANAPHDPYAVLRNRDYVLYLVGRLVAVLGQQMLVVAVGWELYERTHSAMALGLVGLTQMIPMVLCTLPAGHIADNFERKRIILLSMAVIALASLGLAFISALRAPVAWIYLCLFVAGVARTFLWPACASFMPHLVPRHLFSRAVTWNSGSFHLSSVAGPAAGGAMIALTHSAVPVYVFNTFATLTCLTLVAMIRRTHTAAGREPMTPASLIAGFRFVFANRVVFGIITLDMFAVLLGGATSLLPVYAKDILHVGPTGLGLLQAAMPVGAVACALFLAHRPPMEKAGRAMLWAVTAFGVATMAFGVSQWFWLSFLMLVVCGAVDNVSVVVRHTLVQLLTPDEKRGRVSAVNSLFIGTSNELGGFESGTVAHWFGPALGNTIATGAMISVVSGGVGTILVVLAVAWLWPEIRRYGRLDA
jgi:MFS family permease